MVCAELWGKGGEAQIVVGECVRVHIVLIGYMVAEKEAIVVRVGCCWKLFLLSLVTSLSP